MTFDRRIELAGAAVWIMHERPQDHGAFTHENAERIAAKFEYLRGKFPARSTLKRRIFVIGDADNNLTMHYMCGDGRMDYRFDRANLSPVQAALGAWFPDGRNELVVIALDERTARVDWPFRTAVFEPDNFEWQGDNAQWTPAAALIGGAPTAARTHGYWGWLKARRRVHARRRVEFSTLDERLHTQVGVRSQSAIVLGGAEGWGL